MNDLSNAFHSGFVQYLTLIILLCCWGYLSAQNGIGIGTDDVNEDAVLEIDSRTDGLLIPRMTTTQRLAIGASSKGLIVYDVSKSAFYYFDGIRWLRLIANPGQINLDMDNRRILKVANGTAAQDAVNKRQLDTKLNLSGGSMSGEIGMGNHKITNVTDGTGSKDAVNRRQLDSKLSISGGAMTGNLAMSTKKITQLANGTGAGDAVNLSQLEQLQNEVGRLYAGECYLGDVSGDLARSCTFGRNIGTSNYVVVGSLRVRPSDADGAWGNNDVTWVVYNESESGFEVSLEEDHDNRQNLYLRYVIFEL